MRRPLLFSAAMLCIALATADPLQPATTMSEYRALSATLDARDDQSMKDELKRTGRDELAAPPAHNKFGFEPDAPVAFYASPEGRRIADIILSFQTPSGGWSKRTDMSRVPRKIGWAYGVEEHYIPTFDNGATTTQIWALARAYRATGNLEYARAVERAIGLIMLAQYPNGGWPQNFPLTGGYHDYITYNDEAMGKLLEVLDAAASRRPPLDFLPPDLAEGARQSLARGLQAVLDTQVIVDGKRTLWGAQHHPETLAPINARAFEPVALATAESAELVDFLMTLENPSEALKRAIVAAHRWFAEHRIDGYRWDQKLREYSELIPDPKAGPLWARFYEIGTHKPVFGDRDGSVHYNVDAISKERRLGYGWYTTKPEQVLEGFARWRAEHLP